LRVLVTGSSGRIGRAIYVLLARQHQTVGLDHSPSSTADVVCDLGDLQTLRKTLQGIDAVVHVAALHAPHVGLRSDADFNRINVEATRQLAELAVQAGVRRFVFTSTTALYGHAAAGSSSASWIDEHTPPQPRTIYHHSKLQAEALLEVMAQQSEMSVTALRMSRCFPEPAPLMAAYRLHRGVDARDVASAHELALLDDFRGFRRFVISGATPFVRHDLALLAENAGAVLRERAPELVSAFARRGWPLPKSIDRVYGADLATQQLGWRPRYGYDEVLAMFDAASSEVLPLRTVWSAEE
jgi:UDP-glucose 4-epimerase